MYRFSYIKDYNRSYLHFHKTYGHHTWQTSSYDHMATWSHVTNKKQYISTSTRPMTAKLNKVEVYSKEPPSFDALITWSSYHVTKEKFYIPTSLRPWLPNLTESWVLMRAYYPSSHITCWWLSHIRSDGKWKCYKFRDLSLSNLREWWLMITGAF